MKNIIKNHKAITLIALVITIVVLIILAAVAINLSLGNNGIFNRAKTGKELYQNAEKYDDSEVAKATNQIDSYISGNRENISNNLSLNEQVVGTWIDGKPLYQKTIAFTTPSSANTTTNVADLPQDYKDIFIINTYIVSHDAVLQPDYGDGFRIWIRTASNTSGHSKIAVSVNSQGYNTNIPGYVTIQYTKTTD